MQDDVHRKGEGGGVAANNLAETTLDAVALYRHAQNLADGEADTRTQGIGAAVRRAKGEEESHLPGVLFARRGVDALIISVFAKAEDGVGSFGGHGYCVCRLPLYRTRWEGWDIVRA